MGISHQALHVNTLRVWVKDRPSFIVLPGVPESFQEVPPSDSQMCETSICYITSHASGAFNETLAAFILLGWWRRAAVLFKCIQHPSVIQAHVAEPILSVRSSKTMMHIWNAFCFVWCLNGCCCVYVNVIACKLVLCTLSPGAVLHVNSISCDSHLLSGQCVGSLLVNSTKLTSVLLKSCACSLHFVAATGRKQALRDRNNRHKDSEERWGAWASTGPHAREP